MRNIRLKAMFITLTKVMCSKDAVIRPPVEAEDYSFMKYLRTIIENEERTRESCDNIVSHCIARHGIDSQPVLPDMGEWEKYFISLRIVAATTFIAECGGSDEEGEECGLSVKLPKDNVDALRLLLCDHWDKHFCYSHLRLDAISTYFKGSSDL